MSDTLAPGAGPEQEPKPDGTIRVRGTKVTEVIAVSAFILALLANGLAVRDYLAGAIVELRPPELISIECDYPGTGPDPCASTNLSIRSTPMAYINKGAASYNAVLTQEVGKVSIAAQTVLLHWQFFTDRTLSSDKPTITKPVILSGNSVTAHETKFFPRIGVCTPNDSSCRVNSNHLPWANFIALIDPAAGGSVRRIGIDFTASLLDEPRSWLQNLLFGRHTLTVKCVVDIDDRVIDILVRRKQWVAVRPCQAEGAKT